MRLRTRLQILVILFLPPVILLFCLHLLQTGFFMRGMEGNLLVPIDGGDTEALPPGIYMESVDGSYPRRSFFRAEGVREYAFPFMQDGRFFCVGYAGRKSRLYMVEDILPENNMGSVLLDRFSAEP